MRSFNLDVSTVLLVLSIGNLALGAAIVAYRRLLTLERAARLFFAAKLLQGGAWLLLLLRGAVPDALSVVVGNGLLLSGFACEAYSIAAIERPARAQRRLYAAIVAAGTACLAVFLDDPAARVTAASAATAAIYLSFAFCMLRRDRTDLRVFMACSAVLFAAVLAVRALAAARSPGFNLFTPALVQSVSFLVPVLFLIVGGTGFFFILKERDDRLLSESEEKYRTVAEHASEAIGIIQDGRYVYANRTAERMALGHASGLLGRALGDSIWPEDRERVRDNYRRRMAGETVDAKYDVRLIGPDGAPRWTNLSVSRIEWEGRPAALALMTDIDELKKREQRIEGLLADKELLLREVNHRVKNNLSVAVSLLSMQDASRGGKSAEDVLRDAQARLRTMSELYQALNRKGAASELGIGDYLTVLVDEILLLFPRTPPVERALSFDPVSLESDTLSTIGLLVNEVLTNSLKHAFAGVPKPELRVSARAAGDRLELVCADNGPGFDPRASADSSGFGLQVIAMLVRQLGGTMSVDSGKGTAWSFSFPLKTYSGSGAAPRLEEG